jgi:NitT/TauT family transport system substrate-binding protein
MLTKRDFVSGAAALATVAPRMASAQETTKIRFLLDWKYQGIHAFVFWAAEKGYFASEGLDVTVDQGSGSAATVTQISAGAYDAGLGDVNAIIQLAAAKPGMQPKMVYMLYNRPPFALITKSSSSIKTLRDIAGKTLGSPAGGASLQLFPALAKLNGIDPATVPVVNMQPSLQEQMMLNGQVDVSAIFSVTSYINLMGLKVDPDKDIRWFFYADYGIDLYSNGVMVSAKLLAEKPKAVAGLIRAINRALIEIAADPDAAMQVMKKIEPLTNVELEKARLVYTFQKHFVSPETDQIGLGDVKPDRFERGIKLLVDTYKLPSTPTFSDIFDQSALPPISERQLKLKS